MLSTRATLVRKAARAAGSTARSLLGEADNRGIHTCVRKSLAHVVHVLELRERSDTHAEIRDVAGIALRDLRLETLEAQPCALLLCVGLGLVRANLQEIAGVRVAGCGRRDLGRRRSLCLSWFRRRRRARRATRRVRDRRHSGWRGWLRRNGRTVRGRRRHFQDLGFVLHARRLRLFVGLPRRGVRRRGLRGLTPGQAGPQAAQPAPPNTAPGQTNNQTQSSGMQDEPEILEVPPSAANGTAVAPKPAAPVAVPPVAGSSGATPAKKPAEAQASSTAKVTPPAPGDANTCYFLQVGAYKTQADAEQQRARLGFQGFESKVTQRDAGNVTYFRVRIGPFTKFEDMNNVRQRLSDAGVDTAVIRFSKQ